MILLPPQANTSSSMNCCLPSSVMSGPARLQENMKEKSKEVLALATIMTYPLTPLVWLRHLDAIVQFYEMSGQTPHIIKHKTTRCCLSVLKKILCPKQLLCCVTIHNKWHDHIDRRWRLPQIPNAVGWSMYEQRKLKELLSRIETMLTVEQFNQGHYMLADSCFGNCVKDADPAKSIDFIRELRVTHLQYI